MATSTSLTGPQALYLYEMAREVQAGGARPEFHLRVQWDEGTHRLYAEVSINALTLRGGVVEDVQSHISFLEVLEASSAPSARAIRKSRRGVEGDQRAA